MKQKISEAEAQIARINGIIAKIDTALALPDLFTRDPKQAAQLSKARAGAASALQRAEEQWLEARSQYDRPAGQTYDAAGFFSALGVATFGCSPTSWPRSIEAS